MKKTNDTRLVTDLKYALSDRFPLDSQIQEVKAKIDSAQKNISECRETIEFWQKLRLKKQILCN